ncbi:hypothetical protein LSH36_100g06042 [Paralvinella palmiformis]|uniref:Uncharacterized protein n=1 Tax=Paralvinella palmiformis TaxID=53620 RepID=A0AAD9NCN1_9ANNE|nr:hypothetical protein LSH36_100g06042 [Paralvinella palmiformis]
MTVQLPTFTLDLSGDMSRIRSILKKRLIRMLY